MGLYTVTRGKGGKRTVSQINTGEEGQLAHNKALREAEEKAREEARKKPAERKDPGLNRPASWDPSPSYKVLAERMHKHPISWAEQFIKKLESVDEVDRIRLIETTHPKYNGGRPKMLGLLDDRRVELDPTLSAKTPEEVAAEVIDAKESPCPHCDFVASSEIGLQAHLQAVHESEL